jgi:hypothetical protein
MLIWGESCPGLPQLFLEAGPTDPDLYFVQVIDLYSHRATPGLELVGNPHAVFAYFGVTKGTSGALHIRGLGVAVP